MFCSSWFDYSVSISYLMPTLIISAQLLRSKSEYTKEQMTKFGFDKDNFCSFCQRAIRPRMYRYLSVHVYV